MTDLDQILEESMNIVGIGKSPENKDSLNRKVHDLISEALKKQPIILFVDVQKAVLSKSQLIRRDKPKPGFAWKNYETGEYEFEKKQLMSTANPGSNGFIKTSTSFKYTSLIEALRKFRGEEFPGMEIALTYTVVSHDVNPYAADIIYFKEEKYLESYVKDRIPEKPIKVIFEVKAI